MVPTAAGEARKVVTVLFADIVSSTELGERLDPEAHRHVVTRYFAEMAAVLEAHGATVEKFIGDEVMAVFGVPVAHEDDALRAVRAAKAMRGALADLNDELERSWGARLQSRIAINTGEVVAGDASAGHGFVTGDAVTLAKRLQTAAEPGDIVVGDATYELVRHAVGSTRVGPLRVKGKREPVGAQRIDSVDDASEPFVRRLDAPLVGRAAELARLAGAYAGAVASRKPQLVTILGPAGIGKSRLARELLDRVSHEAVTLAGRCLPYGEGITFWPIREILPDESFEGTAEEIFWRVRRSLEEHAGDRPLVVCFEDVHWGEPTFLDLVQYLWGWMRDRAVLFVCVARPELLERRPDWPQDGAGATMLPLGPLDDGETKELLESLNAPETARDRIAEAAEGNPLFVEQMAAMAADEGADVPTPASIRSLLAARLGRLDADELTILERASVIGRDFPLRAVLELVPEELQPRASAVLLGLVRKELVRPHAEGAEDGFRFKHVLIRDAAYEGLPKQVRAGLHEHHADWLAATGHTELLVGYHLEQSVLLQRELGLQLRVREAAERAGTLLGDAGRRAFRRGDMPAARSLFERAVALLPAGDRSALSLQALLANAMWQTGDVAGADALLESVGEDAARSGHREVEWSARLDLAMRRAVQHAQAIELQRTAEAAIPVFEELGAVASLARARRALGIVAIRAGRYGDAQAHLERALADAGDALGPSEHARAADALCTALFFGPESAERAAARCRALLRDADGNLVLEANVASSLAGIVAMLESWDESRLLYGRAREIFEELGLRMALAGLTQLTGQIELLAGDPEAAEGELREGYDILESAGVAGGPLAPQAAFLGAALMAQGRLDEARARVELAERAMSTEDLPSVIVVRTIRSRLATRLGDAEPAIAAAEEAVAVAERTDALNLTGDAYAALAEAHGALGRAELADDARSAARELYRRKGNVAAGG